MLAITNEDCMELMKRYPDKHFDLAIIDPPYGINMSQNLFKNGQNCKNNGYKEHLDKDWDKQIPKKDYFDELFRVSKNQIVFGANYMTKYLPESMGWLVWNKIQRDFSFADGELAWTSFNKKLKIFDYGRACESGFAPKLTDIEKPFANIHPTQKPIALYKWLLHNYAKPGDKILDTHLGSASIAIACHDYGYDLTGCELDPEYFAAAMKRIEAHTAQQKLF